MKTKIAAFVLVLLAAYAVVAYISLNSSLQLPTVAPSPTPPPIPTVPSEQNAFAVGWGNSRLTYQNAATIISPQNNTTIQTNNLTLKVNITTALWVINNVYYKADWISSDYHRLYTLSYQPVIGEHSQAITITANFTGIPDGNHTILVTAFYHNYSNASDTTSFTIDTSK